MKNYNSSDRPQAKEIRNIYKGSGVKMPKGKGIHTPAFHACVVGVTKSMKKNKAPDKAYAICMSKLGKKKAVNLEHRKD